MEKATAASRQLIEAVGVLPARQLPLLQQRTELSPRERQMILEGLRDLPRGLYRFLDGLLTMWDQLSVPERIAALLAVANALARLTQFESKDACTTNTDHTQAERVPYSSSASVRSS